MNTSDGYWAGTKICKKKNLKSPQWLRDIKIKEIPFWKFYKPKQPQLIENGGWHFSFLKDAKSIRNKIETLTNELKLEKEKNQPSKVKTSGSTCKNFGNNQKAWQLIKQSGCESFKEGDAEVSKKHCNFFVNNGNANAADIEKLINKVRETVSKKTGIDLELEIKKIGD